MKKTAYIQPLTYVVTIKTNGQLLQAASPNKINEEGTQATIDPETLKEGDGSDAASRRTIWDDEEDF